MRSVWPVTSTSSSFCTCDSLEMISESIAALPSGLSTALSKSNSAFDASVIFCTCGAGAGAGGGAGGGGGGGAAAGGGGGGGGGAGGGGGGAFGTRSGSQASMAIAGAQ